MNKKIYYLIVTIFISIFIFPLYFDADTIYRDDKYDGICYKNGGSDCSGTVDLRTYLDSNGNSVSCLSPGQCFGNSGNLHGNTGNYEIKDMSSVLDNCKSAWSYKDGTDTSGADAMYCGEAVIYQSSYNSDLSSGLSINSKEHHLAQTIALRMWEASVGADWNSTNGHVDGGVYKRLADVVLSEKNNGYNVSVDDPRIQAIVGGDTTAMNIVNAALNYYRVAQIGGNLNSSEIKYDNDKSGIYANGNGGYNFQLDSNVKNGAITSITLEDGTVLSGTNGNCANGESGCLNIDVSEDTIKNMCTAGKESVKLNISYKSNDAVDSMKRYYATDGNGAGCQQMITFDKNGEIIDKEIVIPCPIEENKCKEIDGVCYGPNGEILEDCSKLEEVCGPCIIEDGKCYRNEEEVDCDECDICVKVGDNCFVAGNQVDCEDYPECEDTCEKRGDKCYVGDKEVNCEDYPECTGICERQPGGGCTLGGEPVNCEDYEECKDFVCKKIGDQCFMGGRQVPCVYPPECEEDEPDNPGNCPIRKIDELPYDTCKNGDTEGELADPPMCSILKNTIKSAYKIDEYSNEWCDVFCRETYSFKFMDKETVQSGRYFRHDVESKYVTISNLSTVVTATQQCTSLINYDDWKKAYMSANSSVRNSFNTVKYWESLWELNGGDPTQIIDCGGGATGCDGCHWDDACGDWQYIWRTGHYASTNAFAVPIQTTAAEAPSGKAAQCPHNRCTGYDSDGRCTGYVCEGTSRGPATTAQQEGYTTNYVREQHKAAVNAYRAALNNRSSLIYKLFNCNFFDDGEVRQYFDDPGTYFTSKYDSNHSTSPITSKTYHDVLRNYAPNSELIDLSYDDQARLREEGSASNVWFDEEVTPPIGTEGIEENKGYKTSAESNDPEDPTVCGGCNDPIHDSLSNTPKSATSDPYDPYGIMSAKEYGFWVCYDSLTGAHCDWEADRLTIPYNYVANLEVTREIGYWQSTQFSTEIFTGKVVEGSGGLQLPEKSWPVAIGTLTGDYNIFLRFSKFGDAKRKNGTLKLEFDDDVNCAYAVVNEMTKYDCDDGYHECYDCDDPSTPINECYPNGEDPDPNKLDLGFYFRSIDLDDVFPNSTFSPNKTLLNPNRPIGSNWNTQNAIQVINKIQDLGEGYLGGGKNPEYTITLTPSMRKQITKNNREIYKADYLTPSTLSCNHSTAICQSTWLQRDLRNILEDYNHGDYYVQNDNSRNNLYVVGRNR